MKTMAEFEDFAITGEFVVNMKLEERHFEIVQKPGYENYPTENDPTGEKKRKLALKIKLSTGQTATYYPNRTSSRKIAVLLGNTNMDSWVGKKFFWGQIVKQKVAGHDKDVLYITAIYPLVEKIEDAIADQAAKEELKTA